MIYSLRVSTTSNATAGASGANTAIQAMMPAGREMKLLAVLVKPEQLTNTQQSGLWVVDRISAVATGSALTPLELNPSGAASAITDTAKTISTTLACTNTVVAGDDPIVHLADGWNDLAKYEIWSGTNQGFAIRRATAPTGAQVVNLCMLWEE